MNFKNSARQRCMYSGTRECELRSVCLYSLSRWLVLWKRSSFLMFSAFSQMSVTIRIVLVAFEPTLPDFLLLLLNTVVVFHCHCTVTVTFYSMILLECNIRNLYTSAPEHCSTMRIAPLDRALKTIFSMSFLIS